LQPEIGKWIMAKLKTTGPEFVTAKQFADILGVSRQAIDKAVRCGRLQAYDADGKPLPPDCGRKRKAISRGSGAGRAAETPAPVHSDSGISAGPAVPGALSDED
jgi:HTH domain